jgi:hypothetical protein
MSTCAMYYKSALHGELYRTCSITLVQFMVGWTAHELLVVQCMGSWIAYMCHYDCISALLAALCMFQYNTAVNVT